MRAATKLQQHQNESCSRMKWWGETQLEVEGTSHRLIDSNRKLLEHANTFCSLAVVHYVEMHMMNPLSVTVCALCVCVAAQTIERMVLCHSTRRINRHIDIVVHVPAKSPFCWHTHQYKLCYLKESQSIKSYRYLGLFHMSRTHTLAARCSAFLSLLNGITSIASLTASLQQI